MNRKLKLSLKGCEFNALNLMLHVLDSKYPLRRPQSRVGDSWLEDVRSFQYLKLSVLFVVDYMINLSSFFTIRQFVR